MVLGGEEKKKDFLVLPLLFPAPPPLFPPSHPPFLLPSQPFALLWEEEEEVDIMA